ncbi:MAG: hypothetical protein AB1571_02120 [Nanoarchaeota archaeon]
MIKEKPEVMHVMLSSPYYLRKEVLKTAIDSTKLLKYFEDIKEIKAKKEAYLGHFKKIFDDMAKLSVDLYNSLPKFEEEKETEKPGVKISKIQQPKKPIKTPEKSKIELELEEIEKKLENIKI